MPGRIFVSYRRDDAAADAARVCDGLAARFGRANVFMDVDHLLPGERFDQKLAEALRECDVLIAIIGRRWMEVLQAKSAGREPDYVRQEIGEALRRGIVVVPVRVGLENQMRALPGREDLPEDIRDLVLYQKHDVAHERFGRDLAELIQAIVEVRRRRQPRRDPGVFWRWAGVAAAGLAPVVLVTLFLAGARNQGAPEVKTGEKPQVAIAPPAPKPEAAPKPAPPPRPVPKPEPGFNLSRAPSPLTWPEERALRPKDSFEECDICPEMMVVPAGEFMMGSPPDEQGRESEEGPQRRVTIARQFAVGRFEVTFAEWDACVADGGCKHTPSDQKWGRGRQPVINVSWNDITKEYLPWLSRKTGKTYRLLTEAEWEYAARAGTTTPFWWGSSISTSQANYYGLSTYGGGPKGEYRGKTVPVDSFTPNPWGHYNVHGNVWEWVQDCWNGSYSGAPSDGSAWPTGDCGRRVLRGGSWVNIPRNLRSANRYGGTPDYRIGDFGFRVGRTL